MIADWTIPIVLSLATVLAWLYLLLLHGGFWRVRPTLDADDTPKRRTMPDDAGEVRVVAVVPARNEADVIERAIRSLLDQQAMIDTSIALRILVVDDHSEDDTAAVVEALKREHPHGDRLEIIAAPPRPEGWVGKMWAVASGMRHSADRAPNQTPDFVLLTDADIVHPSDELDRLLAKAQGDERDLVSLMVLLEHEGAWARLLIPAFVYFFQQLYPFPRVNRRRTRLAAAAGGTMLVRASTLEKAGGIASIRDAVIDDCALARRIKAHGSIWLGLTRRTRSIRPYRGIGGIWRMVARTAFTQLGHSWWLLLATVLGLALVYLAPVALAIGLPLHGQPVAAGLGLGAWILMAISVGPTLRLYGRSPWLGFLLPIAGLLYLGMTLDSARRHAIGRGAEWKGRRDAGLES